MWGYANGDRWGYSDGASEQAPNFTSIRGDADGPPWEREGGLEALAELLHREPAKEVRGRPFLIWSADDY